MFSATPCNSAEMPASPELGESGIMSVCGPREASRPERGARLLIGPKRRRPATGFKSKGCQLVTFGDAAWLVSRPQLSPVATMINAAGTR